MEFSKKIRRKTFGSRISLLLSVAYLSAVATVASADASLQVSAASEVDNTEMNTRKLQSSPTFGLAACLANLQDIAGDDESISTEDYLRFLTYFSGGRLNYQLYTDLPIELIHGFLLGSCFQADCSGEVVPAISVPSDLTDLEPDSPEAARLFLLCQETATYTIDNPTLPSIPIEFNYILKHSSNLTGDELIAGANNNTIVAELISGTEEVALEGVGCESPTGTARNLESLERVSTHQFKTDSKYLLGAQASRRQLTSASRISLGDRDLQDDCRFTAEASIERIIDIMGKMMNIFKSYMSTFENSC